MTTDASCLENIHAQAILELQAGFRFGFAPCLLGKSYQDSIIFSNIDHSKSLCSSRFNIHDTDIQPWRRELILEISTRLNEHEGGLESKPLTGWMDFASATNAFSRWKKFLVFTRVDKAANCLCIICKACYVRLATEEMEGPGYSRIEGVDLASIKSTITKRQADFLRQEHLPIPLVRKQSDGTPPRLY